MLAVPATTALIAANVVVFLLMLGGGEVWSPRFLVGWGGNLGRLTLNGEEWRLVTAMFVHGGVGHIAGNLMCLLAWGGTTEAVVGTVRFLCAYFACGVLASLASASVHPDVVSVGASGAIAGMLGVMVVIWLKGDGRVSAEDILANIGLNVFISLLPSVDWVGHLAGFGAGLALGSFVFPASFVQKAAPPEPPLDKAGRPAISVSFQEPMDFPKGSVVYAARDRLVAVLPDETLVADHKAGNLLFASAADYRDTMDDREEWPIVREFN